MLNPDEKILRFESMAFGGKSVARFESLVHFCEGVLPGDLAKVKVLTSHKRYVECELIEILEYAKYRKQSDCKYFRECGGCSFLEAPYENQLQWKKNFVASALGRIGKVDENLEIKVHASPSKNSFRNRIHLKGRVYPDGSVRVGYFKRRSHDIVLIDKCLVSDVFLQNFFDWIAQLTLDVDAIYKFKCELQVIKDESYQDKIAITWMCDASEGNTYEIVSRLVEQAKLQSWCGWSSFYEDSFKASFFVLEKDLDFVWYTKPGIFQQVNISANRNVRSLIKSRITDGVQRVLDLCCGSGNLSLALAKPGRYIEGIESHEISIESAKYNVSKMPEKLREGCEFLFLVGDATKHLWKCAKKKELFDVVILDPPRAGMYEAMIPLLHLAPKQIFYLSCDPGSLARDISSLCKDKYEIVNVDVFDFFPQTFHVETLLELRRKV